MISQNRFTLFLVLCTTLIFSGTSCSSPSSGSVSKCNQLVRVNGDEAVVISCHYTKPGGSLYFITKTDDGSWKLKQELDLGPLLPTQMPSSVTFNNNWLCLSCDTILPSKELSYDAVLFKRNEKGWGFHHFFDNHGESSFGETHALTNHDTLLVSVSEKSPFGAVQCYDLTQTPPTLVQEIVPPESIAHDSVRPIFGTQIAVKDDVMLILDEGAIFSKQEAEKYALTPDEKTAKGRTKDGRKIFPLKNDVIAYRWDGRLWTVEATFFDLLPHPPGGVLRKEDNNVSNYWFIMGFSWIALTDSTAYTSYLGHAYQFQRTAEGVWKCVGELPSSIDDYLPDIDHIYTVRWLDDRTFDVALTEQIANPWAPVYNVSFINAETRKKDIAAESSPGLRLNIDVSGNVIAAGFNYLSAYEPHNPLSRSPVWGAVALFEFDQDQELHEVFRLETTDNSGLKVVPIGKSSITKPSPPEAEIPQQMAPLDVPIFSSLSARDYPVKSTNERREIFTKTINQAHGGDADAQCMTGDHYYYGIGTTADKSEAVKWYRKAAEQGQSHALYNLATCLMKGYGTEKNQKEALTWYQKAAEQGHKYAQVNLGACYFYGLGTPVDRKEAVQWYRKAAQQDVPVAYFNLGLCYESGFDGLEKDQQEAEKMYLEAAKRNYPVAQWKCSLIAFENGDFKEMIRWQKKSAELGYAPSQYNLGISYLQGKGVPRDYRKGYQWIEKAAKNGDRSAIEWLKND